MNDVLDKAIEHYGEDAQLTQATEELAELIVQISKYKNKRGLVLNVAEEIADSEIMIEQLKRMLKLHEVVENIKPYKIERLKTRLEAFK